MKLAYISHPSCALHKISEQHPECPERLRSIQQELERTQLIQQLISLEATPANKQQLTAAHSASYVDHIFENAPNQGETLFIDGDTSMNSDSLEAAQHAAGAVILGIDQVMSGDTDAAFCAVRPPGHHAERNTGMGFCIFNSIAVGAYHAIEQHNLERIAIIDFDVHHGNGSEDIFRDESKVLLCSSYQHPFYPFSGDLNREHELLNMPLKSGTDSTTFRDRYTEECFPALEAFKPQLILISAGFDAHIADPLASLQLVEEDYHWVTEQLMNIAKRHCDGKIVSSLEGGYELAALGRSVAAHVKALLGQAF